MTDDLISVPDIAQIYGKRRQSIHKLINRLSIEVRKLRSEHSRGQVVSYINIDDYELLKEELEKTNSTKSESEDIDGSGVFYVVQLEPDHDPGRIKVGFATSMEERLRKHKTAAPFSKVINTWPCKFLWEKTAIECVTQGCERLYTEVFRTDDLDAVISKCDRFFSLMPVLDDDITD